MKQNMCWKIPAFMLVCLVLVMACSDLNDPVSPPLLDGKGTVSINFGGGNARTLLPSQFDLSRLHFVLTFTQVGGGTHTVTQTGQDTVIVQLNVGTWNLDIRGYASPDVALSASTALVYYIESGIAVSPSTDVTVTAVLLPNTGNMTQNETGTLSYEITIPQGATGTLTVLSLDGSLIGQPVVLTQTVNQGNLELASGEYNISVNTGHEGAGKTWWGLAHIYDSAITKAIIGLADFSDVLPDYGTITITLSMDDFTMLDEGYGVFDNVEQPIVLSKSEGSSVTIAANGLNVVAWRIGGTVVGTGNSITLNAANYNSGSYFLNLTFIKNGRHWQSNLAFTVIPSIREIVIDMFDSNDDGWDNNGALRINVNGIDIATTNVYGSLSSYGGNNNNTPSGQGSRNTYTFTASIGDIVQLYWVAGSAQGENSFIVYYADTPPSPAFTSSNNSTWNGSNALACGLRGAMGNISGGTLLGSFTVSSGSSGDDGDGTFQSSFYGTWYCAFDDSTVTISSNRIQWSRRGEQSYTLENITWTPKESSYVNYQYGFAFTGTLTQVNRDGILNGPRNIYRNFAEIGETALDWWYMGTDGTIAWAEWDSDGNTVYSSNPYRKMGTALMSETIFSARSLLIPGSVEATNTLKNIIQ